MIDSEEEEYNKLYDDLINEQKIEERQHKIEILMEKYEIPN